MRFFLYLEHWKVRLKNANRKLSLFYLSSTGRIWILFLNHCHGARVHFALVIFLAKSMSGLMSGNILSATEGTVIEDC